MKRRLAFLLTIAILPITLLSQNLTISSSGQTGTSGTNWSISGNTLTVTSTASIQASVIENHLAGGNDLFIECPGDITVNQAIAYSGSSAQALTLNAKYRVIVNQAISSSSGALSVVLMGNYSYNSGGVDINANITTNGGHFFIGGGYNTGGTTIWNGLSVSVGMSASYTGGRDGVEIVGVSIQTSGGDIKILGRANSSSTGTQYYAVDVDNATINAGGGDISIIGSMTGLYQYGAGVIIESTSTSTTIETTGAGSINISGDIEDRANSVYGWRHGLLIITWNNNLAVNIRSENGDITLDGSSAITNSTDYDNSGLQLQTGGTGSVVKVVSQSGNITLKGTNTREALNDFTNGIRLSQNGVAGSQIIGQEGSTPYTGNIKIQANSLRVQGTTTGALDAQTSGDFTIEPVGNSFTYYRVENLTTQNFQLTNAWDLAVGGNLTLGKSGNAGNLRIYRDLIAGGDITLYGGDIDIHNSMNATGAGSQIGIYAQLNIHTLTTQNPSVTTGTSSVNGGDIMFISDVDGNATGNIYFSLGLAMNSHGGNILLAGGDVNGTGYASGHLHSPYENEGVRFEHTIEMDSEGGNITMRGRNTTNAVSSGYGNMGVGSMNNGYKSFDAGSGKIYIEGIARNGGGYDPGIGFYSGDNYIEFLSSSTASDAIVFKGSSVADEGIVIDAPLGARIYATGAGGGITMEAAGTLYGINFVRNTDVLAVSGPITLFSTNNKSYVNSGLSQVVLGSKAGTPITASSSDIEIGFDAYNFSAIRQQVNTTGDFTLRPADGSTSFAAAVSNDWFTWSSTQLPSSLTMGAPGNNAEISIDVDQTVAGPISLYGSLVDINANLTSSATGDILLKAIASGNDDINIATGKSISKSSGTGTLLAQASGRFNSAGSITASGSGSMNTIIWTDYDNTNNAGVSNIGTINSGGGHVWVGGSATAGGSQTWNGLTVGDGGSTGSTSANQNGIDFNGSITSSGGDVYIWSAGGTSAYSDLKFYSGSAINSGSGDITIVSDEISNTAPCAITTTGHFTWEPNTTNGWATTYINQLDVDGNYSGANYTGVVDFDDFQFINFSSFGGFTLGNTTQTCGIYLYDDISVNGPVEILGIYAVIGNDITAAGDILIDADFGSQASYSGIGVNIFGTAQLSTSSNGNITVLGRGGTNSGGNQIGVVLNSGSSLITSGTGTINVNGTGGASSGDGNRGVAIDNATLQTSGANLTITGTGGGTGASNSNDAVSFSSSGNVILAGEGDITINGTTNPVGSNSESLSGDGIATIGGSTQTGDITLRGDNIWFGSSSNISTVQTTGNFTLEPHSTSFEGVAVSWPYAGLSLSGSENSVTLGKDGNTFDLTIGGATTVSGDLTVYGGAIAVNAAATATNSTLTLNGTTISGSGALTASKAVLEASTSTNLSGALTATDVSILGTGSATLSSTSNDFTTLEAGTPTIATGALSITESNGFTVGAVDNAGINSTGTIDLSTQSGDLTISEAVATTSTSTSAITFNAGKSKSAGDATGGNLIVSGNGSFSVGSGAITKLFSSDDASSTGLSAQAASYADVFAGYDETSDLSGLSLSGDNTYVFYRASSGSLTIAPSLVNFSHCGSGNSDPVAITVSGSTLAQDVTVTAPSGYELATTSTGTYQSSLTLTQTAGTLASTTIYARATSSISVEGSADLTFTSGTLTETVPLVNGLNNALSFDGTDDMIEMVNTGQFDINTMTLEGWFNSDIITTSTNNSVLFNMRTGDNSTLCRFSIHMNLGTKIIGNYNGLSWLNVPFTAAISNNEWFHVAVVLTTSTTTYYINGELVGTTNNGINTSSNANMPLRLGMPTGSGNHPGEWWDGEIDEVRVWNDVRTGSEIAANYSGYVSSSEAGLLANFHFDQGIEGGTNTGNTILKDVLGINNATINNFALSGSTSNFVEGYFPAITGGSTIISNETVQLSHPSSGGTWSTSDANVAAVSSTGLVTGIGPGTATITYTGCDASATYTQTVAQQNSIDLDGSNDRVRLTEANFDNLTGDLTIEAWVYFDAADGANGEIFMKNGNGTGSAQTAIGLRIRQGDLMLHLGNGSSSYAVRTTNEIPKQQWVHIAAVLDHGTEIKLYYNGVNQTVANPQIVGSGSVGMSYNFNNTSSVIGAVCTDLNTSYANHFNGQIDELRIWSEVRSQSDIQANLGQQIDPAASNLEAYYRFNYGSRGATNTGITSVEDLTGNGNDGVLQNSSLSSTSSNWVAGFMPEISGNKFVLINGTTQLQNAVANGTWASSNTSIATVDQTGLVTAVAVGSATITYDAMDNQVSKTIHVLDADAMGAVTIVASGGDAENVDWTVTGGQLVSATTSAVNVNASDIIPHLASSDLIINASAINMVGDLNTTSSQTLTLKSRSNIIIDANVDLVTSGGSVILWSNADGQTSEGFIVLDRSTITTNGGHLWIGGGSGSTTWNSLTVGDGKAVAGTDVQGTVGSSESCAVFMEGASISTGSGHISMNGEGTITSAYGIITIGTNTVNAGSGTLAMDFETNTSGYRAAAFGFHHSLSAGVVTLTSSNSASNAINLSFDATAGASIGSVWAGVNTIQNTGSGGISMYSEGKSGQLGMRLGYSTTDGCDLRVLAGSGDITINSGITPIEKQNSSSFLTVGSKASTAVTSSTSNITITTSDLDASFAFIPNTTGTATVKPASGSTFTTGATTAGMTLPSTLGGLVIGDASASSQVNTTIVATTINGPMTVYGNDLTITGDLTTNGNIRMLADGNIAASASVDFDATSGDIVLWADYDANSTGNIIAGDNVTFTTAGGNIYLAGGVDSDSDNYPDGYAIAVGDNGVELGTATSNTTTMSSGGGDIVIKGKSTGTATNDGHGITQAGLLDINSGTGSITLDGASASRYGINFSNVASSSTPWKIKSSATSGTAISITGTATSNASYGVVFNFNVYKQVIADGGGAIEVNGIGNSNYGIFSQNVDYLSSSGTITLNGGVKGVRITNYGNRFGAVAGTPVMSSSANVTIKGDEILVNDLATGYTSTITTSGTVTFSPYTTGTYGSGITWPSGTATSGWNIGVSSGSGGTTFTWDNTTVN